MANWSVHPNDGLRSVRCPVHSSFAVKRGPYRWVWKCAECLAEAREGIKRIRRGVA